MQAVSEAYIVWYDTTTSVIRKARILTMKEMFDFSRYRHTPGLSFQMKGKGHSISVQHHAPLLYTFD